MTRILIVTGSRTIADKPDGRARLHTALAGYMALHPFDVLVVGDARGPDTWAAEWALGETQLGLEVRVFEAQSGRVRRWAAGANEPDLSMWIHPDTIALLSYRERCLRRNAEMVRIALGVDPDARMAAFQDPRSPTHGTAHTISQMPAALRETHVTTYEWSGP